MPVADRTERVCIGCGVQFTPSPFGKVADYCSRDCKDRSYRRSGRHAGYARTAYYRRRYGLSALEAEALRKVAVCGICGTSDPQGRHGNFHIDHDHDTGEVRGVLCHNCNLALGHFQDDIGILRAAISYLEGDIDLTP